MHMKPLPLLLFGALLLTACQTPSTPVQSPAAALSPVVSAAAPLPSATPTAQPTAAPTVVPTPAARVCAPLEGYTSETLETAVSNPYHPPKAGSDDPHQGVDLVVKQGDLSVAGHNVQAALSGTVVMALNDRFPYGNAVLIATALDELPAGFTALLPEPPQATAVPDPRLTCPSFNIPVEWNTAPSMLYILYAHMQSAPTVRPGDSVTCGQTLGTVGNSGNAINPHLHFEVRLGPANASFDSMAHYDASASADEMANYCTWRISGWFQHLDPLPLLAQVSTP